jgi:amino acid adenylation domain-containing protein
LEGSPGQGSERRAAPALGIGEVVDWGDAATIPGLFEQQVARTPAALAVVFEEESLDFAELDRRANRLARFLIERGAGPGTIVGLCMERSLELVVGMLATLKAGAAYLPLDPDYPADRIGAIVASAQPPIVLSQEHLKARLHGLNVAVFCLDHQWDRLEEFSDGPLEARGGPEDAAYVIYTSGSTGTPKGVINSHRGICNRLLWMQSEYRIDFSDVVLQKTPFSFDVSVWEFFWPLITGARMVLARPGDHREPGALARLIARAGVTVVHFVPSMLEIFLAWEGLETQCRTLKHLFASGEALLEEQARKCLRRIPARLHNLYGPTEAAVDVTFFECHVEDRPGPVPIGRPIANMQTHVLDANLRPVALGAEGELYLGGVGVALGYVGRPDLTAERFLPDPFSPDPKARLYRTGDLCRWRADGNLEYLGRSDQQVKLRGQRIELGEIECTLVKIDGIQQAVVVVADGPSGDARLVAYLVGSRDGLTPQSIREHLRRTLPEYMVPAEYVWLSELPLTPSGKTDRRKLQTQPLPIDGEESRGGSEREPSATEAERRLAEIWQAVLARGSVGRTDNFFQTGGHSLLAMRMVARVREQLGIKASVEEVFAHPVLADLAAVWAAGHKQDSGPSLPSDIVSPLVEKGPLPALPAQQGMWLLQSLLPDAATYNQAFVLRPDGPVDWQRLERAWEKVVAKHPALRTGLVVEQEQLCQRILPADALKFPWREEWHPGEDAFEKELLSESRQPFSLSVAPLWRAVCYHRPAGGSVLLLVFHHTIIDDWSLEILWRDLEEFYGAGESLEHVAAGPPAALQELSDSETESHRQFWRKTLAGVPEEIDWGGSLPVVHGIAGEGSTHSFHIGPDLVQSWREMATRSGGTLFQALLAAFHLCLHRMTGIDDVVVGTPVTLRLDPAVQHAVGCFLNTLPIRVQWQSEGGLDGKPFASLLDSVSQAFRAALGHARLPLEEILATAIRERHGRRQPVVNVLFVMVDEEPLHVRVDASRLTVEEFHTATAKYDVSLHLQMACGGLRGFVEYSTELFDVSSAKSVADRFVALLAAVVEMPQTPVGLLALVSPQERRDLLATGVASGEPPPPAWSVHELFSQQAQATPDATAVVWSGGELTYRELRRESRRWADLLRSRGVAPNGPVGVCMPRSPALYAAMLGVMESGGCCVPLDPTLPPERLARMLDIAGCRWVVAVPELLPLMDEVLSRLRNERARTEVLLPGNCADHQGAAEAGDGSRAANPEHLAYILFTSGSTGEPKGVAMPHGPLANLNDWQCRHSRIPAGATTLQFASPGFDVSFQELFATWLSGGTLLCVAESLRLDPGELLREIIERGVARVFLPAVMLEYLAEAALASGRLPAHLREVIVAGEQLRISPAVRQFFTQLPGCRLWNQYGPTESHVVTSHLLEEAAVGWPELPFIGRPIANARLYVLDPAGGLVPVGAPGEIWIGGACLAAGYIGRSELSSERFLPDPFASAAGARMYRTGDLGRWTESGELEYIGRSDNQLKIRGHRVEPGEVEVTLSNHPGVRAVAVVPQPDSMGAMQLVAFVSLQAGATVSMVDLRAWTVQRLPSALVPAQFMLLEELPLNVNGKLDRRALEREILSVGDAAPEVVDRPAPSPGWEQEIAALWNELLGGDVRSTDDFFACGGTSLTAMRLVARASGRLGVEASVRDVFEHPTLSALAAHWLPSRSQEFPHTSKKQPTSVALPEAPEGELARVPSPSASASAVATPAQTRLWFLQQYLPGSPVYHVPFVYRLRGPLHPAALAKALESVAGRHSSLRTTFELVGTDLRAPVSATPMWPLAVEEATGRTPAELEADALHRARACMAMPFDLERGPLVRGLLVRMGAEDALLVLVLHHIVCDGGSLPVLHDDLALAYTAALRGREPLFPEPAGDFASHAAGQAAWLESSAALGEEEFWRATLADVVPGPPLPTDRPRPPAPTFRGGIVRRELSAAAISALTNLANREQASPFMLLLTAVGGVLSRWSGAEECVLGIPCADRADRVSENVVGFLVNTLPLRLTLGNEPTFRELLKRTRNTTLAALAHARLPFDRMIDAVGARREPGSNPLFQTMVSWQDDTLAPFRLPGLSCEPLLIDGGVSRLDLTFFGVRTANETIELRLEYSSDLFDPATVERLLEQVAEALVAGTAAPQTPISHLPAPTPADCEWLRKAGCGPASPLPHDTSLAGLFEQQVDRSPGAVAVVCGNRALTYAELDAEANRLAAHVRALGVESGQLVGILLERSAQCVIAVLGILKAGCGYAPLPAEYPQERLAWMIADAGVPLVITEQSLVERVPQESRNEVAVFLIDADAGWRKVAAARQPSAGKAGPAYCMYTSGSTGRPKGVVVPQRAVARLLLGQTYADFGPQLRTLLLAPTAFDASTFELWAPLLHGGTCVVFPERLPDLNLLERVVREQRVNCLWLTAGLFNLVIDDAPQILAPVAHVLTGGDALSVSHVRRALELLPNTRLTNGYGPTESTTFACTHAILSADLERSSVPIGRPIANTTCVIVDASLRPVPVGMPGELVIGGDGLALEYLHQPELSAEKFVTAEFFGLPVGRFYRTGDRCRWLSNGTLEFLGRLDGQLKILGHRVELGEIEAALAGHPDVAQVAVVVRQRQHAGAAEGKLLRACLVPRSGRLLDHDSLRQFLAALLPGALVPTEWLTVPTLPLTPQGKLDRLALAALPLARGVAVANRQPTALEHEMLLIWERLFDRTGICPTDNFFNLGGNSLLAARLAAELERRFGRRIPIVMLFQAQTVESLAALLATEEMAEDPVSIVPVQPQGSQPPLFLMHGIWGNAYTFVDVARHLGTDQPVYGFAGCMDGPQPTQASIAEMAEQCVAAIRTLKPRGPYALGGFSAGGWVAYEMAQQLRAQGEEVDLLAQFDTHVNCRLPQPLALPLALDPLGNAWALARYIKVAGRHLGAASRLLRGKRLAYLAMRLRSLAAREGWAPPPQAARELPTDVSISVVWRYYRPLFDRYRARRYQGAITFFRAQNSSWLLPWVWRCLAGGGVRVHRVSCLHQDIFTPEHAAEVAGCLQMSLESARFTAVGRREKRASQP